MNLCIVYILFAMAAACFCTPKTTNTEKGTQKNFRDIKCSPKPGTMRIYGAGCIEKAIRGVGCKGYCLSSSKPGLANINEVSHEFQKMCSCCQPKKWKSRTVQLNCPKLAIKHRRVQVYEATQCSCMPCRFSAKLNKNI